MGAERLLGYTAAEVMEKITPVDVSDPLEVVGRAKTLSTELGTEITPDVILMNINLPGIGGINAMRILASDSVAARIPVIALSGKTMPHDIARGLSAGFFRYPTQPIKVREFMETLDEALSLGSVALLSEAR